MPHSEQQLLNKPGRIGRHDTGSSTASLIANRAHAAGVDQDLSTPTPYRAYARDWKPVLTYGLQRGLYCTESRELQANAMPSGGRAIDLEPVVEERGKQCQHVQQSLDVEQ